MTRNLISSPPSLGRKGYRGRDCLYREDKEATAKLQRLMFQGKDHLTIHIDTVFPTHVKLDEQKLLTVPPSAQK